MLKATAQLKPRCRAPCASVFVGPRRPFLPWPLVASMESNQRAARPCRANTIIQQVHFLQCPCGSRIGRSLLSGNESKTRGDLLKTLLSFQFTRPLCFSRGPTYYPLNSNPALLGVVALARGVDLHLLHVAGAGHSAHLGLSKPAGHLGATIAEINLTRACLLCLMSCECIVPWRERLACTMVPNMAI